MAISTFSANNEKENSIARLAPITISTHRRILLRRNSPSSSSSSTPSTSPTRTSSISLHHIFHHVQISRPTSPVLKEQPTVPESDEKCWERMLDLQMEYHCYKSARLEAAVEARMSGYSMEEIPRPSRLCLDLLNEEFNAKLEAEHRNEI